MACKGIGITALVSLVSMGAAQVAVAQNMTMEIVPVGATGVESTDWTLGPGPRDILLFGGGQAVELHLMLSGWGPVGLTTYQAALDCSTYAPGTGGALEPVLTLCPDAPAGEPCQDVDASNPDYVFTGLTPIPACDVNTLCPDGSPGKIRCGSTLLFGNRPDDGGSHYGATFMVYVPDATHGTFTVSLLPDMDATFITLADNTSYLPDVLLAGQITVGCGSDADCDDGNGCTLDACNLATAQCESTVLPPDVLGDYDHNGNVDWNDTAELSDCISGVGPTAVPPCCRVFDMDLDRDVDLHDIALIQNTFTGTP